MFKHKLIEAIYKLILFKFDSDKTKKVFLYFIKKIIKKIIKKL